MVKKTISTMNRNYRVVFIYTFIITMGVVNVTMVYLWTRHAQGFKHPHLTNDVTCFDVTDGDALPPIDGDLLKIAKNVYFLETSCRGYLDSIQACAVESAARKQFDSVVHVIFAGPVNNKTLNTGVLKELKKMNVQISRIKMNEALKGTPLERITKENLLSNSVAKVAHASDILRLYLLWKYSGIYLDLDVISLKPFFKLETDFAGIENTKKKVIANGVLGLSNTFIGRSIASILVEELADSFETLRESWSGTGPALLTQTLMEICNTTVPFMNSVNCLGFEVYNSKVFYPLESVDYYKYRSNKLIDLNGSYTIHLWNKLISTLQRKAPKDSLLDNIAKAHCPTVYEIFKGDLDM